MVLLSHHDPRMRFKAREWIRHITFYSSENYIVISQIGGDYIQIKLYFVELYLRSE